jgi:hypothetical protein
MRNTEQQQSTTPKQSLDDINNIFKIPITFNPDVKKLNENVVNDLELIKPIEKDQSPIYDNVFKPSNKAATIILDQFANHYTIDSDYLSDTQDLIKTINPSLYDNYEVNNIINQWEEIKGETGFREKYLYIDWEFAKHFNNNPLFLQVMSCYNLASPLLSLCLPIFILIVPFFIIKMKGIPLTIQEYINILKILASNHAIFKIATQFHKVDNGQKFYLAVSAAFYLFSIYQNILVCVRFYSNMQKIHNYLLKFKQYIKFTLNLMDYHQSFTTKLTTYYKFNANQLHYQNILNSLFEKLDLITPFSFSISKIGEIGHIMHTFYQIYDKKDYNDAFLYSFGFHGYFSLLNQISYHVKDNKITKTKFIKKGKPIFKQMYYPKFIDGDSLTIIKNDCNLNKNMIITGPNASGKTTTLKTALINIILSQQIGYGCFESLKMVPYDHIHCYLNIPDTSGRDSLFQAEARRCKEIIDCIDTYTNEKHFCIFDELYSGTNPDEAIQSATAFMNYIVKNDNITCLLTTHYVKLCKKLAKNKKIKNYNMKSLIKNDNFEYTYLIERGISKIKGGLKVLKDMNYPQEILDNTK